MTAKAEPLERPDLDEMVGAIHALADEGTADSLRVVCLVHRLLQQDWSGKDVYEVLEMALDDAERLLPEGDIDTEVL